MHAHPQASTPAKAVLVGSDRDWPSGLKDSLVRDGYTVDRVTELSLVPSLLADGRTRALFVAARPLAASDLLLLRRVREASPRTAIVVVTSTPTHPDLKRAFESGATAFLSWPASTDALRQAIESGQGPPGPIPSSFVKPLIEAPGADARLRSPQRVGQLTLNNRLPSKHAQRAALEDAIRSALSGFPGRWDVVLEIPGGQSLVVAVVGPDGSAVTISLCNPEHRDPASIAETVRAACRRRRWFDPAGTTGGSAETGAASAGSDTAARERR